MKNIYPGCVGMTYEDAERMNELNRKNGWGLSREALVVAIRMHKKAREDDDVRTMEMIEYRLTDINFHTECRLLSEGKYDEAIEWFDNL